MNEAIDRHPAQHPCVERGDNNVLVDCVRGVLARLDAGDWRVDREDFWCRVGPVRGRMRVQGWKLHLSATPLSAPLVLAVATEILVRHGCAFKFAATIGKVQEIVSRNVDRSGGGKFITVYPDLGDDELRALAEELHRATEGLPGPGILSDRRYRPGSLVHYRFGAFSGVPTVNNDGGYEAMLVAPDNSLVHDSRKAWFAPPPWAPPDPFVDPVAAPPAKTSPTGSATATARPVLLDGRYLVNEVIRHSYTGGVYRATDQRTGATVIVKQARRHAGGDLDGRDVRDLRRHEAAMLEAFGATGRTPRVVGLFEQQGELFLVQEQVPGVTLRQWVVTNVVVTDDANWGPALRDVTTIAEGLVDLMEIVHDKGFVLRDFNPNNVMVDDDLHVWLIDLEMLARPGDLVTRALTPGYGAPEQRAAAALAAAPDQAADLYGLGATLFYLVSGTDPALPADAPQARPDRERVGDWLARLAIGNAAARAYAAVITDLLHEDPRRRPGLAEVRTALAAAVTATLTGTVVTAPPPGLDEADLKRMITDGIDHLLSTMRPDNPGRLWPTGTFGGTTDACNVQHGAAGVLGLLARAYQVGPEPALHDAVATAATWIRRRATGETRLLPGLYFGRSGTAWSLLDAGRALGDEHLVRFAEGIARAVPVRWPNPDICHGAAGAGMTQLRFWEATGDEGYLHRAREAADAVARAVEHRDDGVRWPIPRAFASRLAGTSHYGFAHGVAGCAAFLLAAGRVTGEDEYLALAARAADTLVAVAQQNDGAAYWAGGDTETAWKTNWCSGSSGVGTFLVQVWRTTGEQRFLDLAQQAAVAVHRSRWHAGPCQCHGLAGDGEFLLDLAEASGDGRYRDWAGDLAVHIYLPHALRDGRMVPPDDSRFQVTADFNSGLSGVVAFLLRLRDGGPRMWLPEAFTRPERAR